MAPPVDVFTTRLTPARRAASSTLIVPTTLIPASQAGSSIDLRTSIWAARWKTMSGRSAANSSRNFVASRMSASWTWVPRSRAASRLDSRPVERSSTTTTSSPRSSRASTRLDPMNPAPPVTSARMARDRRADPPSAVDRREPRGDRLRRGERANVLAPGLAGGRVAEAGAGRGAERVGVAGRREPARVDELGQGADRGGDDGHAVRHRLGGSEAERLGRERRDERQRRIGAQAGELGGAHGAGEAHVGARGGGALLQRAGARPVAGDHERQPGRRARVDGDLDALLGREA